ncbi:unnamed protein product, partial [Owenia fusiformis]
NTFQLNKLQGQESQHYELLCTTSPIYKPDVDIAIATETPILWSPRQPESPQRQPPLHDYIQKRRNTKADTYNRKIIDWNPRDDMSTQEIDGSLNGVDEAVPPRPKKSSLK